MRVTAEKSAMSAISRVLSNDCNRSAQNLQAVSSLSSAVVSELHPQHPSTLNFILPVFAGSNAPERLAVDADFFKDVLEELGGALLDHVVDPQAGLEVLQEPSQETNKVLCCANRTWNGLWWRKRTLQP